jgi:hypothetical protein
MFKRNCPNCNEELLYKNKFTLYIANKNQSNCRKCNGKKNENFIKNFATKGGNCGPKNGFYGKSHSEEVKQKIRDNNLKNIKIYQTDEFKQKISKITSGSNNPNYGVSNYSRWLKKYGKEEADIRLEEFKQKISKVTSGENNPMYGKPPPKGSGVGWKGWYKNHFFRSLRELTYILTMEENNIKWISAENIRIKYKCPLGNDRTYSPDFLVGSKLIEIKPIRLHDTPLVLEKSRAGLEYCRQNGLTFEIVDVTIDSSLIDKYRKDIKFLGKYEDKYKEYKN